MNQLIDCCEDKKYARFLNFVRREYSYNISNIGTILSKVPSYSRFEQIFSAGFENIVNAHSFTKSINDIPKSLIKIARDRSVVISDKTCDYWKKNPDNHYIGYNLKYISLTDKDVLDTWSSEFYKNGERCSIFNTLIEEYGYNAKSLFLYVDTLKTFEAIEHIGYLMKELYDYARMMKAISPKFDRYPRNFLTTHKIACRNYNRLKKEFPEELFKVRINKDYECTFGDYQFIYPTSTQDIKDEAVMQNNCVASYIDDVVDGKCHIMFLRKKTSPKNSLVTIEIRNNSIVQAKRRFNDPVTDEDQLAIDYWNKKFCGKKERIA